MTARVQNDDPSSVTYEYFVGRNQYAARAFDIYKQRYNKELVKYAEAFNNGVAILNLRKWRREDEFLQREYTFWMQVALDIGEKVATEKKPRFPWWFVGNQAIMWFVYQQNVVNFPFPGWHCDGLGWRLRDEIPISKAKNSKLLHWNGDKKPWLDETGPHYDFWAKYRVTQCAGKGVVTERNVTAGTKHPVFYECGPKPPTLAGSNNNQNNNNNHPNSNQQNQNRFNGNQPNNNQNQNNWNNQNRNNKNQNWNSNNNNNNNNNKQLNYNNNQWNNNNNQWNNNNNQWNNNNNNNNNQWNNNNNQWNNNNNQWNNNNNQNQS